MFANAGQLLQLGVAVVSSLFKDHPTITRLALCTMVVAVVTWELEDRFVVKPLKSQNESLLNQNAELKLKPHPNPPPVVSGPAPKPRSKPDPEPSSLSIRFPKNIEGTPDPVSVGPKSKVGIAFKNIPLSQHLWLVVKTPEGGFWAHGKCPAGLSQIERTKETDHWETPDDLEVYFSVEGPITKPQHFTIYAVAVGEEENNRFMDSVRKKCANSFKGLAGVSH